MISLTPAQAAALDRRAEEQATNQMNGTYSRSMKYVCVMAFLLHVAFMALFAWNGVKSLAAVNIISLLMFAGGYYAAHINKPSLTTVLATTEVVCHAIVATFIIGWDTGFHYYVILLLPVFVMSSLKPVEFKVAVTVSTAALYGALQWALSGATPPHPLPHLVTTGLLYFNLASFLVLLMLMSAVYYVMITQANKALYSKTQDVNNMLQNLPEGVLTVGANNVIHHEYSAYLETILETKRIAGENLLSLLFKNSNLNEDICSQIEATLGCTVGEDELNFDLNSHLLVDKMQKTVEDGRVKLLELGWSPICNRQGTIEKVMVCVRDVTELKRLESEANDHKRELEIIGEILPVSREKFSAFVEGSLEFIEENRRIIVDGSGKDPETINLLFRNMHTIKGNARTHGLRSLTNAVHLAEQAYQELRQDEAAPWNPDQLIRQLDEVRRQIEHHAHINDVVLGRKGPDHQAQAEKHLIGRDQVQEALAALAQVDADDNASLREVLRSIGNMLHMAGARRLDDVLAAPIGSLASLAKELGKEAPVVAIEDHGIKVRDEVGSLLENLFTHQLRNAVDHGLERADQRIAQNKPAQGHIAIRLALDDGKLWIRLRDDGRGLAIAKIRQRAQSQGLIPAGEDVPAEKLAEMIFRSGFSTAETVTEVSGRGVGMDAVKGFLEKKGGSIEIRLLDEQSEADFRPFETVITLPEKFAASETAGASFAATLGADLGESGAGRKLRLRSGDSLVH